MSSASPALGLAIIVIFFLGLWKGIELIVRIVRFFLRLRSNPEETVKQSIEKTKKLLNRARRKKED